MLIIGERINASRKSIARAIEAGDKAFIQNEARMQDEAGADYIDVNAALYVDQEVEHLKWIIEAVQMVTEKPLSIDSPDPASIQSVLPLVDRPPIINSVTLVHNRLERILALVKNYKAKVIGLCQSETVMGKTTEEKTLLAGRLVKEMGEASIPLEDVYIDPLIFPVAVDNSSALATLAAIEKINAQFPEVHTICGLTNISHGLPKRKLVNLAFLVSAVSHGLDAVIMDPTDKELYGALKASIMIMGGDVFCMEYIQAFRRGRLG